MISRVPSTKIIIPATEYLIAFLTDSLARSLEIIRIARAASALSFSGNAFARNMFQQTVDFFLQKQRADGGWNDIEETVWATSASTLIKTEPPLLTKTESPAASLFF